MFERFVTYSYVKTTNTLPDHAAVLIVGHINEKLVGTDLYSYVFHSEDVPTRQINDAYLYVYL